MGKVYLSVIMLILSRFVYKIALSYQYSIIWQLLLFATTISLFVVAAKWLFSLLITNLKWYRNKIRKNSLLG